ncbi:MAG: T9SS type A sorting domain-containing protein [Cytophagales bacterium]|nr:T9SS type A sorting domain-containing protein [Cytophagales bacterium]
MRGVIVIFLFIFSIKSISQQIYFNNRYDFYNVTEVAWNVMDIDSGYLVVGGARDSLWNLHIAIMLLDNTGNVVWKKSYGQSGFDYYPGFGGSFIHTNDGGFALGGGVVDSSANYYSLLLKFDNKGDTLWSKMYGDTTWQTSYQCKQTMDEGYILIGAKNTGNGDDILLIKTDSVGNFLWQKTYGGSGTEYGLGVGVISDGYILSGYTNSFGAGEYDTYIIKVDNIGNLQWSKTFGGPYTDNGAFIISTSDGGYILSTGIGIYKNGTKTYKQTRVIKLFNNGTVEWDKTYGPVNYNQGLDIIYELSDGSFLAVGQKPDANGYPIGFLFKINSQGDSIWWKEYELLTGNNSQNYLRDVKPTSDGGYIACGFVVPSAPDTGMQDMWVIKLDGCGCAYAGCDTICSSTIGIIEQVYQNNYSITVYPNPANETVTFDYKLPENTNDAVISIYNLVGNQLKSYRIDNERGTINITISDLPNGLYFYSLKVDNNTIARNKLLIIK